jgi:hypothetical protein
VRSRTVAGGRICSTKTSFRRTAQLPRSTDGLLQPGRWHRLRR